MGGGGVVGMGGGGVVTTPPRPLPIKSVEASSVYVSSLSKSGPPVMFGQLNAFELS